MSGLGLFTELCEAINAHDPDRVAACFTEDFRGVRPLHPSEDFVGNAQVRRNYAEIFERLPDLRAEVLRTAEPGDELWAEFEMTASSPDGASVVLRGPVIMTVRDGRFASTRFYIEPVDGATT